VIENRTINGDNSLVKYAYRYLTRTNNKGWHHHGCYNVQHRCIVLRWVLSISIYKLHGGAGDCERPLVAWAAELPGTKLLCRKRTRRSEQLLTNGHRHLFSGNLSLVLVSQSQSFKIVWKLSLLVALSLTAPSQTFGIIRKRRFTATARLLEKSTKL